MRKADHPLVALVVARINRGFVERGLSVPPPAEMPVSAAEYSACLAAVKENMQDRGEAPIPYTRTGRGILFKNIEIYIRSFDAHLGAVDACTFQ